MVTFRLDRQSPQWRAQIVRALEAGSRLKGVPKSELRWIQQAAATLDLTIVIDEDDDGTLTVRPLRGELIG